MAFQLSPGVLTQEIDLTTIVPAVGTTEGAIVGSFLWGPVSEIRTISSEVDLVNTFGKPDSNTFVDFFVSANFLSYARNLKVIRANSSGSLNATANGAGIQIDNKDDYDANHSDGSATSGAWTAKYPGALGNSLKVSLFAGSNTGSYNSWAYKGLFNSAPGTSNYANLNGGKNDEMHIVVIDEDGKFTGTANTVLERYSYISKASDAKNDDGSSNYYATVINNSSKYIWWMSHPTASTGLANTENWGAQAAGTTFGQGANVEYNISLSNGTFTNSQTDDIVSNYARFRNADEVNVSLVMNSGHNFVVAQYITQNLAEYRKDCVAFISPEKESVLYNTGNEVTDVIADRNALNLNSSYAVMDSGWKYQFDKYNNTYRWIPLNGDIAGLCVRTDYERDPWFSPAGPNRGVIKNVIKLAWNPNQTERDELYPQGVNPVVTFPGEGTILFGDKTLLARPSSFDRINVRRLFIVLEKAIARAARYSLFEFNDAFTRSQFVSMVEPYLRDVKGRRGIYDFRVVCDETNNTPEVIDRNEFVGDIYVKPSRSINFITLHFISVRTGVSFDEVVGQW